MGCGYSTYSAQENIVWKYSGPPEEPLKAIRMFDQQNGLLFRLIYDDGERWAFYNDTKEYEFRITYYFSNDSDIEVLNNATLTELENGTKVVQNVVYPLETENFIVGVPGSYTSTLEAVPVSERFKWEKTKDKFEEKEAKKQAKKAKSKKKKPVAEGSSQRRTK